MLYVIFYDFCISILMRDQSSSFCSPIGLCERAVFSQASLVAVQ